MAGTRHVVALALLIGAAGWARADEADVAYPEGYRGWYFDHSSALMAGHTPEVEVGIANVYANPAALEGLKTGKYADGAVFVIDRYKFAEQENHVLAEGDHIVAVVMQRDAKRFADTGGWGFEGFLGGNPNKRLVKDVMKDGGKACFTCHAPLASSNFVFTHLHQ
jgi:hypothetical protein